MEMYSPIIFSLLLLITAFSGVFSKETRVIGGEAVNIVEYPFMAYLRMKQTAKLLCGGVIVNTYHVLSTANCIKRSQNREMVVITGSSSSQSMYGPIHEVSFLFVHPNYVDDDLTAMKPYDIGVVRLRRMIHFDEFQFPLALPTQNYNGDTTCTILGWGITSFPLGVTSLLLRKGLTRIVNNSDCSRSFGFEVPTYMICVAVSEQISASFGDHGGPLLGPNGEFIGLASYIVPSSANIPNVYTRVYPHIYYIRSIIENN